MRMPLIAGLVLAAAVPLAACGSVAAPAAGGSHEHRGRVRLTSASQGPPAGSRAEAGALAGLMLSRLRLPAGARRMPPEPVPLLLRGPLLDMGAYAELDQRQLFQLPEPMSDVAAALAAAPPAGMDLSSTGGPGGPPGGTADFMDVTFADRSLPTGIYLAWLVLTVAQGGSGGSVLRADAQVIWYPPRSAAEHIDPARYHALAIAVTLFGTRIRHVRTVVTSRAVIRRLAGSLNRSPVEPVQTISCPAMWAIYRLAFSASPRGKPAVVVTATQAPCEGTGISVGGHRQPPLDDDAGVAAVVGRLLGISPGP
jgi:hypothetical protein